MIRKRFRIETDGKKIILAGVVVAFLCWQVFLVHQWVRKEARPPAWDPAVHLGTALDYREALRDGRWLNLLLAKPRPGHPPYPPLYHYTLIPLLHHPQPHIVVAWLNLAYLAVFVFAGAWAAFQIGGILSSAVTILVLGLSPSIISLHREAFPDLSLAAWVALAYALILYSDNFGNRRASIGAGFCVCLALLSKWSAVVYLSPVFFLAAADKNRRRNLALAGAVAVFPCLPWYLINGFSMIPRVGISMSLGSGQGQPSTWTLANWLYYPRILNSCYGTLGTILMLIGLALAIRGLRKEKAWFQSGKSLVVGWLLVSYITWSFVSNKNTRYILPTLAAFPAIGLSTLPRATLIFPEFLALVQASGFPQPNPERWPLQKILQTIESQRDHRRTFTTLCVLPNHSDMNATSLTWLARYWRLPAIVMGGYQSEIPEWSDFVLLKTKDPGRYLSEQTTYITAQALKSEGLFPRVFREINRWDLPDGSQAVLYQQRDDLPLLTRERSFAELKVKSARLGGVRVRPLGHERYEIFVSTLQAGKLPAPVRDLRLHLEGAGLIEYEGHLYVTQLQKVKLLSGRASWQDLSDALTARTHLPFQVDGRGGVLKALMKLGPIPVRLVVSVQVEGEAVQVRGVSARLGGIRLPFIGELQFRQSLAPHPPYQPYGIEPISIAFEPNELVIGAPADNSNRSL